MSRFDSAIEAAARALYERAPNGSLAWDSAEFDQWVERSDYREKAQVVIGAFLDVMLDERELADVLKRHYYGDRLLGNITHDQWQAICECGWESGEYQYPGEADDEHFEHASRAVAAYLKGESNE